MTHIIWVNRIIGIAVLRNLQVEIVDPIINGHYEKENFCNINYPVRNIFYLNRGDGLLTPILENLGLRGC